MIIGTPIQKLTRLNWFQKIF